MVRLEVPLLVLQGLLQLPVELEKSRPLLVVMVVALLLVLVMVMLLRLEKPLLVLQGLQLPIEKGWWSWLLLLAVMWQ